MLAPSTTVPAAHHAYLERLGTEGHLRDPRPIEPRAAWYRDRTLTAAVEGALDLGDRVARVQVGLPVGFPSRLPVVAVDPRGEFAALPHVEPNGAVCYRPRDEPLLDREDPFGIVREALNLVAATLRAGLHGDRAREFADEIVAYWSAAFPKAPTLLSLIEPDARARLVTLFLDHGIRVAVADSPAALAAFRQSRNVERLTFVNAVYVPVEGVAAVPDFHPRQLCSAEGLRAFALTTLSKDRTLWRNIEQHCRAREVLVVLGVARPAGRRGLVAVAIRRRGDGHPLDPGRLRDDVIAPRRLEPVDRGFVLPRGGADTDLGQRRVLVVGCGAVGGHVAMNLARAGVGIIELMDFDEFVPANTYRHVCGRAYLGKKKVVGLKLEIERLLPFVEVRTHLNDVLTWATDKPEAFRDFDVVVLATGNPTVELQVNATILRDAAASPAIFAWLEPFGLGGHALVTHVGATPRGCYECLYARDEDGTLVCRAAFARPGARYTRDVLGCGSQHVAFGDVDAQQLAASASRAAVAVLRDAISESVLTSWKGDATAFRGAGFETTIRYERSGIQTQLTSAQLLRPGCPVCHPS
ncbi:ThiF family adenylyltransferase [Sorangium sp. So ce381]|uniref:ThiF family adenylyltransferase n=1 Tax=Sorangium sp. So ce381 TaxID=3133307 RepID=UPI003F5BD77F